jgi:hypothetical protein
MHKEDINWIDDPRSLVGERIQVLWKEGKRYGGLVTKYSASSKVFTVLYDDGEEKYYDLFDKTFRVAGESSDWTPTLSRPLRDGKAGPAAAATPPATSAQNPLYNSTGRSHISTPASNFYNNTGYGSYGANAYNSYQHQAPSSYKPRQRVQYVSK